MLLHDLNNTNCKCKDNRLRQYADEDMWQQIETSEHFMYFKVKEITKCKLNSMNPAGLYSTLYILL